MFEKFGFKDENVIAITKYKDDIVVVPCEDAMSGIYPDYRKAIWLSYAEGDKNRTGALWETGKNVRTKGLIMQSFCF